MSNELGVLRSRVNDLEQEIISHRSNNASVREELDMIFDMLGYQPEKTRSTKKYGILAVDRFERDKRPEVIESFDTREEAENSITKLSSPFPMDDRFSYMITEAYVTEVISKEKKVDILKELEELKNTKK